MQDVHIGWPRYYLYTPIQYQTHKILANEVPPTYTCDLRMDLVIHTYKIELYNTNTEVTTHTQNAYEYIHIYSNQGRTFSSTYRNGFFLADGKTSTANVGYIVTP